MAQQKVVVVTGSSRGLGRGIARQFGKLGAKVYLTSRSSSAALLAEAAAEVEAWGGQAIAVPVDHREAGEVEALVARIRDESGCIDILVNNATAVHPDIGRSGPFWERSLDMAEMIDVGLKSSYMMNFFAAPMMIAQRAGLIANISFYGAVTYFHGPAYGAAKGGTDKMTFDMAWDLRPHNVACVSLWPGFIYSDTLAQYVESVPKEALSPDLARHLPNFERPEFSALVLNALHEDPELMSLSGQALIGAELGERYDIADIDGKRPLSFRATMGGPQAFVPPTKDQPMSEVKD